MEKLQRRDKINYYLDLAETVSQWCTCLRKHYGAVIVNCSDLGYCLRTRLGVPRGERYELCRSVHAEANAIISASRNDMLGSTLYLVGKEVETGEYVKDAICCSMCKRMVINAGIAFVVVRDDREHYRTIQVNNWVEDDESLRGVLGY